MCMRGRLLVFVFYITQTWSLQMNGIAQLHGNIIEAMNVIYITKLI